MVKIDVKIGDVTKMAAEAVVVNLFEGASHPEGVPQGHSLGKDAHLEGATGSVDALGGGWISKAIADGDITGKLNEITLWRPTTGVASKRVVVVGLGKPEKFSLDMIRQVSGTVAKTLQAKGITSYATIVHGAGAGGQTIEAAAQAVVEGTMLGSYHFEKYRQPSTNGTQKKLAAVTLIEHARDHEHAVKVGWRRGEIIARAVMGARDWVNEPANVFNPSSVAGEAKATARRLGWRCEILEARQCEKMGMGAFMSVTKGSDQPPKFIVLEYRGGRAKDPWVALVGKGVTFDTGGISLKPGPGMGGMKGDMAGAAACFHALQAATELKMPLNVVAILPFVENMPSGHATRPGDVVKALSGKTIEILNTDAEGRMILADALAYSERYALRAVVDMATLTGAVGVALGREHAAVLGTDADVVERLKTAGRDSAERLWELPVGSEYDDLVKSDIADMKNIGDGSAGTIVGGVFLKQHVKPETPWAHLDIAAVMGEDKGRPYVPKGASGFGVRLLVQFLSAYTS